MPHILNILRYFVDTRLLIGTASVGLALSTVKLLNQEVDFGLVLLVFASTLVAYTYPLFLKVSQDSWVRKAVFVLYAIVGSTSICFLLYHHLIEAFGVYVTISSLTLFYYIPMLRLSRLRDVPLLKAFLISFSWCLATVVLPASYYRLPLFNFDLSLLAVERFLFLLAITIPFDIRDIKPDREGGLLTLPIVMGMKNSLLLSSGLLFAYFFLTILHYGWGQLSFVRLLCILVVLILIQKINPTRSRYYYTGLIDGSMIFQSVLLHVML